MPPHYYVMTPLTHMPLGGTSSERVEAIVRSTSPRTMHASVNPSELALCWWCEMTQQGMQFTLRQLSVDTPHRQHQHPATREENKHLLIIDCSRAFG